MNPAFALTATTRPAGRAFSFTPSIVISRSPFAVRETLLHAGDGAPLGQAGFAVGSQHFDHACMVDPVEVDAFAPEAVE